MVVKVAISCDDLNPTPGYGLFLERGPIKHIKKLNEKYGCKTTMFTVPLWEENEEYDLRKNKQWLDKLKAMDYLEVTQHGLTHKPQRPEYEGQEFAGLPIQDVESRIAAGKKLFAECNINVDGFKSPGWTQPKEIYAILKNLEFKYIADHFVGDQILTINGLPRIPYTWTIDRLDPKFAKNYKDGILILHSHINPVDGRTLNAWTNENYNKVDTFLEELHKHTDVEYVFFSELVK